MNTLASSLLLPENDNLKPKAFYRLFYHFIRVVQQLHRSDNPSVLQPLIDQVDQAIQPSLPKGNPGPSSIAI